MTDTDCLTCEMCDVELAEADECRPVCSLDMVMCPECIADHGRECGICGD